MTVAPARTTIDAGVLAVALSEALEVQLLTGERRLARAPGARCRIQVLRPTP